MNKVVLTILLLFLVNLGVHGIQADEVKQTATIIDTAGMTLEVTDLAFSGQLQRFDRSRGIIAFSKEPFQIAVPFKCLISIEAKGDTHTITYLWREKEVSLTGTLFSGTFTGSSVFGDIELDSEKVKSLEFDRAPKPTDEQVTPSGQATLTLADGTQVNVDTLKRHDSFYSTEGYLIGGRRRYRHYTDFRFLRGEMLVNVSFDKVKRIDFTGEKDVAVLLTSGEKATGTLSSEDQAGIVGWTAVFDKGELFLPKEQVKIIEFAEPPVET